MKTPPPVASRAIFAWTAILTVLLACFAFVTLLTNSKTEIIRKNIQALQLENDDYHNIDTCIAILYAAENNSRLYVVTQDSAYLHAYRDGLRVVTNTLSKYETDRLDRAKSLSTLISNKKRINEEFVSLKVMVDSLVAFSFTEGDVEKTPPPRPATRLNVIAKISKTDTIELASKRSKKKLVKRIMDAIKNTDAPAEKVTSANTSVVFRRDSIILVPQLEDIKSNVLLEQARRRLTATEQQLLAINGRIFANLQNALQELKIREQKEAKLSRDELLATTTSRFEEMNLLIWGSVLLALSLAVMIIWNLVRLYKKDVTIIRYAKLSADNTRRKGDLMAQMTHEIRTPLNSIIGFSQLIDDRELEGDLKVNISAIKNASRLLLTVVNEILDFSKFESGKITLQNGPFHPAALINEAVSMLSVLANEKQIQLSAGLDIDPMIRLNGDEFRIKQIVINLLTNAIKFTPEAGRIAVSAKLEKAHQEKKGGQDKAMLQIRVKDSGVGIAKEDLEVIFEDFVQVGDEAGGNIQAGTGLGLAICKRIVRLYGGDIKVESNLDKGSEFIVSLPLTIFKTAATKSLVLPADGVLTVPETPGTAVDLLKGKKVLIADDTKMNLLLISKIMDKLGASYDLVGDGQKAFESFSQKRYDLVITDIHMPVMDGMELTKRVRSHTERARAATPVIGFTGDTGQDKLDQYAKAGINGILPKPFDTEQLQMVLKQLLDV